ncbi:MAG TPA: cytochrome ubiquinol oxidase subunit I [Burkholderiales bacterium]
MDALLLSRLQFAFTVSFHIIFPAFTIGLSAFIATLLVMWRRTGKEHYHRLARFWTKIFAVSFAMGVVSGIPMSYQFGTNWSRFAEVAGNVVGPLIGYEVLTAFFLEATFLGVMLFGWRRVPPWLHVTSAILVALGTALSGFWILSANSWMQTPVGYEVRDGIAYPADWLAIIFNPSFIYRFLHMMNAAYLTTSVVVLAVGARYLLAQKYEVEARTMMRMGAGMVALAAPIQLLIGDLHGLNTLEHQPVKVAAMEAHWGGAGGPVDFVVLAWPDQDAETNRFALAIPYLGSLILTHTFDEYVPGLKDFAPEERPPVALVFFAFRLMLLIGLLLIALGIVAAVLWRRGRLFASPRFLRWSSHAWPLGFIAIVAGWIVTESGRQPYTVQGLLLTRDAVSPVATGSVLGSLVAFVIIYVVVFSVGIYYINRLINRGPTGAALEPAPGPEGLPNRPLSTAQEPLSEAGSTGAAR